MTKDEMRAYAQTVAEGGSVKKADVVAFMKAFLEAPMKTEIDGQALPALPFEIEKTESGLHLPREANRSYTKIEAQALAIALLEALK